jgi:hypothetical protein
MGELDFFKEANSDYLTNKSTAKKKVPSPSRFARPNNPYGSLLPGLNERGMRIRSHLN